MTFQTLEELQEYINDRRDIVEHVDQRWFNLSLRMMIGQTSFTNWEEKTEEEKEEFIKRWFAAPTLCQKCDELTVDSGKKQWCPDHIPVADKRRWG